MPHLNNQLPSIPALTLAQIDFSIVFAKVRKELRENLSEIIEEAAIGKKQFIVTKFDKPKAVIIPLEKSRFFKRGDVEFKKLSGFGMWRARKDIEDSSDWVRKLRERQSRRLA